MRALLFALALCFGGGALAVATGVVDLSTLGTLDAEAVGRDLGRTIGGVADGSEAPASTRSASRLPDEAPAADADADEPSIWRYVDDEGRVQFVSSLSQVPGHLRDGATAAGRGTVSRTDARATPRPRALSRSTQPTVRRNAEVVVYTTSWCGYCRKTLAWLNARGIDYENRDIEQDDRFREELERKTGRTAVPVVEVNGRHIRGYDPVMLERLLVAQY